MSQASYYISVPHIVRFHHSHISGNPQIWLCHWLSLGLTPKDKVTLVAEGYYFSVLLLTPIMKAT